MMRTSKRSANAMLVSMLRAVVAGLLAWLVPGAGHWYLDRPVRAAILFVTIHALFWSGVAIGGVFSVNPRQEVWWCSAQMLSGLSGLSSYARQEVVYRRYHRLVLAESPGLARGGRGTQELVDDEVNRRLAQDNLALVPPVSGLAYVLTGVAGMLNLMCIFDAVMLSLLGQVGEPAPSRPPAGPPARQRRAGGTLPAGKDLSKDLP